MTLRVVLILVLACLLTGCQFWFGPSEITTTDGIVMRCSGLASTSSSLECKQTNAVAPNTIYWSSSIYVNWGRVQGFRTLPRS